MKQGAIGKCAPDSPFLYRMLLFCLYRNNRNLLSVSSFSLETYNTIRQCEQRIVSAASHIHTRMNSGSALSVKDVSSFYKLSVRSLSS